MKMKKRKIISLLTGLLSLALLAGCSPEAKEGAGQTDDGRIKIVTTIFPPYDFTKNIVGDRAQLDMLLPFGTESHSYEPSPKDIIAIQNSDLFIYVGGTGDYWVDQVLSSMGEKAPQSLAIMDAVTLLEEEYVEGMALEEEEDHDDHEEDLDEHVWTSPKNAMAIVQQISDKLVQLDGENKVFYETKAQDYLAQLAQLDQDMEEMLAQAQRKTIVVGDRFPFRYLTHDYGLDYYAAFLGCSNETEPSAANIAFLSDLVKGDQIPVVFYLEFSSAKVAEAIARDSGAQTRMLHSAHNISRSDFEAGLDYIQIMEKNILALKEALSQ